MWHENYATCRQEVFHSLLWCVWPSQSLCRVAPDSPTKPIATTLTPMVLWSSSLPGPTVHSLLPGPRNHLGEVLTAAPTLHAKANISLAAGASQVSAGQHTWAKLTRSSCNKHSSFLRRCSKEIHFSKWHRDSCATAHMPKEVLWLSFQVSFWKWVSQIVKAPGMHPSVTLPAQQCVSDTAEKHHSAAAAEHQWQTG